MPTPFVGIVRLWSSLESLRRYRKPTPAPDCDTAELAEEAYGGRGVVASLVPGPADPSRITALKFPCPRDQAPWSFVLQDGQQPAPVTGSIAVHQARDTVAEKGGPGDEGPRQRPATASYAAAGLAPATQ